VKRSAPISVLLFTIISFTSFHAGAANLVVYSTGDRGPAGGIIIFNKGNSSGGWQYLEAAPNDQSAGVRWWNGEYTFVGNTGKELGKGKLNTSRIIAIQGVGGFAAMICVKYRGGGKSDWYLPSKDEITVMRAVLKNKPGNGLNGEFYWSSTEIDGSIAWLLDMNSGKQYGDDKDFTACVRAVRAF
jgi:hypothetical protein